MGLSVSNYCATIDHATLSAKTVAASSDRTVTFKCRGAWGDSHGGSYSLYCKEGKKGGIYQLKLRVTLTPHQGAPQQFCESDGRMAWMVTTCARATLSKLIAYDIAKMLRLEVHCEDDLPSAFSVSLKTAPLPLHWSGAAAEPAAGGMDDWESFAEVWVARIKRAISSSYAGEKVCLPAIVRRYCNFAFSVAGHLADCCTIVQGSFVAERRLVTHVKISDWDSLVEGSRYAVAEYQRDIESLQGKPASSSIKMQIDALKVCQQYAAKAPTALFRKLFVADSDGTRHGLLRASFLSVDEHGGWSFVPAVAQRHFNDIRLGDKLKRAITQRLIESV